MAATWLDFWNGSHRIYVNARHAEVHYAKLAADFISLIPAPSAVVVDWGCGDAYNAEEIVAHAARLVLCDAAPATLLRLRDRFGTRQRRIDVVAPEALRARYQGNVDLFVVNSVLQYLSDAELDQLIADARAALAPGGTLIIADVIPLRDDVLGDVRNLLRIGMRNGFFLAALIGLVATFFSPYRRLRTTVGLKRYDEAAFLARLRAAGFDARRMRPNLGFDQRRMAFTATRPKGVAQSTAAAEPDRADQA
ncbi:MAG: class I SAM-dependent methyltransferase [Ancalomicrobiaceae bacterium]|nr:class I SAM-dependent methyltransferase [Ancalomicrobiaceae bacterium]